MRDWLIAARGARSQESVASQAGISQNHLSNIENGTRRPTPETAKKLAAVLGVPWTKFFDEG